MELFDVHVHIVGYLSSADVELISKTTGETFARDDFLALSDVTVRPFGLCLNESELTFQVCDVKSESSLHPAMCRVPGSIMCTLHVYTTD